MDASAQQAPEFAVERIPPLTGFATALVVWFLSAKYQRGLTTVVESVEICVETTESYQPANGYTD